MREIQAERARRGLIGFTSYTNPAYQPANHHHLIADKLEAVERGEIDRLMIFMPPRHGKSELASRKFPARYLGLHPTRQIIAASYNSDLATDFGRDVRNLVASPEYGEIFPGVGLRVDSKAADRMNTNHGGVYIAAGVGTATTGRGAHLGIIDDPFKDREDADSELQRERVWNWYRSTFFTRLMPGGAVVLIQCMTGDTPVLMADGSEKPLRDICIGDAVATYENGTLAVSQVVNWINQGPDIVYEITTTCGKVARANERHPFLIDRDGALLWVRLKDLRIGDGIVRVDGPKGAAVVSVAAMTAANGSLTPEVAATDMTTGSSGRTPSGITENGRALSAPPMAATSPRSAKDIAPGITSETSGPAATGRPLRLTRKRCATENLSTATELAPPNMTDSLRSRGAFVPFAEERTARDLPATGEPLRWTTATTPGESGGCSATTATLSSAGAATSRFSSEPSNTYSVTKGRIASIRRLGSEDVFDIQVERTENFIAGGLVSHNTRWHEDDLAGRLLDQEGSVEDGGQWHVLELPAIADGKALWPEWYNLEALDRIRKTIGPREWSALYMQAPQPDEGTFFQREWLKHWTEQPKNLRIYGTSDYAVTDQGGDYTVHRIWGVDPRGALYRLDGWRGQTASDEWIERKVDLIEKWKPMGWFGEGGVIQKAIEPMLVRRMREREARCRLEWLPSIADKPTRARGFQNRAAMGEVWFEPEADLGEFLSFPAGKHDDDVDCASLIGRALDMAHPAIVPPEVKDPGPLKGIREMTFNELLASQTPTERKV